MTGQELWKERQDREDYHLLRKFEKDCGAEDVALLAYDEFCMRRKHCKRYYHSKIDEKHWLRLGFIAGKFLEKLITPTKNELRDMVASRLYYVESQRLRQEAFSLRAQQERQRRTRCMPPSVSGPARTRRDSLFSD